MSIPTAFSRIASSIHHTLCRPAARRAVVASLSLFSSGAVAAGTTASAPELLPPPPHDALTRALAAATTPQQIYRSLRMLAPLQQRRMSARSRTGSFHLPRPSLRRRRTRSPPPCRAADSTRTAERQPPTRHSSPSHSLRQGDPMECPCIQDMKNGPCGPQFVSAYRCFLDSTEVRLPQPPQPFSSASPLWHQPLSSNHPCPFLSHSFPRVRPGAARQRLCHAIQGNAGPAQPPPPPGRSSSPP
jgi:hypothetical protein